MLTKKITLAIVGCMGLCNSCLRIILFLTKSLPYFGLNESPTGFKYSPILTKIPSGFIVSKHSSWDFIKTIVF